MKPRLLTLLLLVAVAASVRPAPSLAQAVYFEEANPTLIVLGNSFYEVGLQKANGAIAYITDKTTGQRVSEGSRYGCLWGASGQQAGYIGGCSYAAGAASRFSYDWSAPESRLSLRYTPSPAGARQATALVTLTASPGQWFDLQLQLENRLGGTLDYILFPSELVFRQVDMRRAYLPVLPGIALERGFFAQSRSYVASYPGDLFADYVAVESRRGTIALYSLFDESGIRPLVMGFNHDDGYIPGSAYYYHAFGARSPDGDVWASPRVRVRVGQPVGATIDAYRADNGIDRFASLASKAGAQYQQLARSYLLKADASQLSIPFAQYADALARAPAPALLHPLAFQQGGFDENHPDLLPPAAAWGGTADLAAMMLRARAMGFLTMPYTNPTWWDDQSPTLRAIVAAGKLADAVVLDAPGSPRYETYGAHGGYVMSPYAPLVAQRLAQQSAEMTAAIPGDLVFEDQVGARGWHFDDNAFSPGPTAYAQGWLDHTRAYSGTLLMTEGGNDRLAATELGFHGSVLLAERLGQTGGRWGEGNWRPYPIAPMMLRDKVLLYQHNLAPETFTTTTATLAWNMAFGYMLSYDLGRTNFGGGVDDPWLAVVGAFQKNVLSRYAGERMLRYESLGGAATLSSFKRFSVVTNWSVDAAYPTGPYVLPPAGAMAASDDGTLVAGVFSAYNGKPLAGGEHYLIEERGLEAAIVRQPLGADTDLTIRAGPAWRAAGAPTVTAFSAAGAPIGVVASSLTADGIAFRYQRQLAGADVSYYRVAPGDQLVISKLFIPLVQRAP